ncbi:hypothetical protein FNV43_RR05068 [Rhamnella rubrinervis]|uniref:SHSP domain-containing protein n=1 Tax=Rhamnella rubrinervis TaxID=2594499 RepID=A0A8K0HN05_9ROSA|nr:hypothetical protein FNV43_RR05068 [Rhamnella rubrinervis]
MSLIPSFFGGRRSNAFDPFSGPHVFKADVPGLRKEEVKVEVEDDRVLQIRGERNVEKEDKNDTWHRVERSSGKFMRRFRLPENAKMDQIKAGMENGVLTVTVPKEEVRIRPQSSPEISKTLTGPARLLGYSDSENSSIHGGFQLFDHGVVRELEPAHGVATVCANLKDLQRSHLRSQTRKYGFQNMSSWGLLQSSLKFPEVPMLNSGKVREKVEGKGKSRNGSQRSEKGSNTLTCRPSSLLWIGMIDIFDAFDRFCN